MTSTVRCDLLCIGGGLGGLVAAGRGAELGMEVVVAEASDLLGGVAAYSGGHIWIPANPYLGELGVEDTPQDALAYIDHVAGPDLPHNRPLRRRFVDVAPKVVAACADAGVHFQPIRGGYADSYYPSAPGSKPQGRTLEVDVAGDELGPWAERTRTSPHFPAYLTRGEIIENGGMRAHENLRQLVEERRRRDHRTLGPGLAAAFVKYAIVDHDVEVRLGARAIRLIERDGRIAGAVLEQKDGEHIEVEARQGVLIATGSYGNAPYAAAYEGLPEVVEASPPLLHGDHLTLTDPTRAAVVRSGRAFTVLGAHVPGDTHPGTSEPLYRQVFVSLGYPHCIVVNRDGERFGDESYHGPENVDFFDPEERRFVNYPCWMIADDRFRKYPFGPFEPGASWPSDVEHADSLGELAEALGVNPVGLRRTVERFNVHAEQGMDPEFARGTRALSRAAFGDPEHEPNPNLGPLEQPPFWGVPLKLLGVGIYSMGLRVDEHARVCDRQGTSIPGLYAAGNAVAYEELPTYLGGFANARNLVQGHLAASHAAGKPW